MLSGYVDLVPDEPLKVLVSTQVELANVFYVGSRTFAVG